jgi:flagellin
VTTGSASGDVTYAYTITDSSGTEIASAGTGSGSYTGSAGDSLLESAAGVVAAVINAAEALDGSASSGGHSGINAVAASDGSVTVTQAVNVTSATGSGGAYASGAAVGNGAITGTTSVNVSTATTTVTFGSGDLDIANIGSGGTAETFTLTVNGETITYDTSGGDYAENIGGLVAGLQEQIDANTNLKGVTITAASGGTSDELVLSLVSSVTLGSVSVSNAAATSSLDITTSSGSKSAIDAIDTAIQTVNSQRANLGAISNRLDSTVSNLTNISSNLQAGRGRIEDADFAAETTSLAKSQILQQASTAMLAQANASKQNVLSLLQG